jgi:hypothetical protein
MTREDFNRHIAYLRRQWPLPFFVARSFRTGEEWRRWSSLEFRARALRDGEPQLENVLYHRRAIVVGEAGSGKSLVARKAIELGAQQGFIPLFVPLKEYSGDLAALILRHSPDEALRTTDIDTIPVPRLYIDNAGSDRTVADRSECRFR